MKTRDEVLANDRKKLGVDTADPQNCSVLRRRLRRRNPTLDRKNRGLKFYKKPLALIMPLLNEPRSEKTGFLHMRKQRRRSASR